jgi:hypothetical protein
MKMRLYQSIIELGLKAGVMIDESTTFSKKQPLLSELELYSLIPLNLALLRFHGTE